MFFLFVFGREEGERVKGRKCEFFLLVPRLSLSPLSLSFGRILFPPLFRDPHAFKFPESKIFHCSSSETDLVTQPGAEQSTKTFPLSRNRGGGRRSFFSFLPMRHAVQRLAAPSVFSLSLSPPLRCASTFFFFFRLLSLCFLLPNHLSRRNKKRTRQENNVESVAS